MSSAHRAWLSTASTDNPMIFTLRLSNSGLSFAIRPSSVVQIGVKSFGWENRTAHESPIQSWNPMVPSVVSAVKSGAVAPSERPMSMLLVLGAARGDDRGGADATPKPGHGLGGIGETETRSQGSSMDTSIDAVTPSFSARSRAAVAALP